MAVCNITPLVGIPNVGTLVDSKDISDRKIVPSKLWGSIGGLLTEYLHYPKPVKDEETGTNMRAMVTAIWEQYKRVEKDIPLNAVINETLEPTSSVVMFYLYRKGLLPSKVISNGKEIPDSNIQEKFRLFVESGAINVAANLYYHNTLKAVERKQVVKYMGMLYMVNREELGKLTRKDFENGIQLKDKLLSLYIRDTTKIRKEGVDPTKDVFYVKVVNDLMSSQSAIWNDFRIYMTNVFGVNIDASEKGIIFDTVINEELNEVENTNIEQHDLEEGAQEAWNRVEEEERQDSSWDDSKQSRINPTKKMSRKIKFELSKIIATTTSLQVEDNIFTKNKIAYTPNALDITEVWRDMLDIHRYDLTEEDIIRSLERVVEKYPFLSVVQDWFNNAITDVKSKNLAAAYAYSMSSSITEVLNVKINPFGDRSLKVYVSNRNSFTNKDVFDGLLENVERIKSEHILDRSMTNYTSMMNSLGMSTGTNVMWYNSTIPIVPNFEYNRYSYYSNKEAIRQDIRDGIVRIFDYLGHKVTIKQIIEYAEAMVERSLIDKGIAFPTEEDKNKIFDSTIRSIKQALAYVMIDVTYKGKESDEKGNIAKLAKVLEYGLSRSATFSFTYTDVNKQLNYSPEQDSFLTKIFRGLVDNLGVNNKNVIDIFSKYTNDKTLYDSNFLWANTVDSEGNLLHDTNYGIFNYTLDANGTRQIHSVNEKFIDSFRLSKIDGIQVLNKGVKSHELVGTSWKMLGITQAMQGRFVISNSDSSRKYVIGVPLRSIDGLFNEDFSAVTDLNHPVFNNLRNIAKQGFAEFSRGRDLLYDKVGNAYVLKQLSDEDLAKIHKDKYFKSVNGKLIPNDGNTLVGNAFRFIELDYVDSRGVSHNLLDYISIEEELSEDINLTEEMLDKHINRYIIDFIMDIANRTVEDNKYLIPYLTTYSVTGDYTTFDPSKYKNGARLTIQESKDSMTKPVLVQGLDRDSWINKILKERIEYKLNELSIEQEVQVTEISKEDREVMLKDVTELYDSVVENILDERNFNWVKKALVQAELNIFINEVEFANLFYGRRSEYANPVTWNKRVGEITKNGGNPIPLSKDNAVRNILVVSDRLMISNHVNQLYEQGLVSEAVVNQYKSAIDTTDGMSIISDIEYEELMKRFGKWDEVKGYVQALRNNKNVNPNAYNHLVEQLKLFIYERENFTLPNGEVEMRSKQFKDSTIILFPATVKGTQMQHVYDILTDPKYNIQQVSTNAAGKVTGVRPLTIHNSDGTIDTEAITVQNVNNAKVTVKYNSIVNQQDVHPDILDSDVIQGMQLTRHVMHDLFMEDAIYEFEGRKVTGRDIFNEFDKLQSSETMRAANELLNYMGVIVNNRINVVGDQIVVDRRKMREYMRDYALNDQASTSIINALNDDGTGNPTIPFSAPMIMQYFRTQLLSKYTRVVRDRVKGLHVPLRSDFYTQPTNLVKLESNMAKLGRRIDKNTREGVLQENSDIVEQFKKDSQITYIDSIHKDVKNGKRTYELKAERWENGVFKPAEVILNPWAVDFYRDFFVRDESGKSYVDINKIPEGLRRMIGFRIPTENKNSSVLFEVVGFLNTGSSQAVAPYTLITRTGWDFDIDTIYAYSKNYTREYGKNYNIVYREVEYHNSITQANFKELYTNFLKNKYRDLYNEHIIGTDYIEGINKGTLSSEELFGKEGLYTRLRNVYTNNKLNSLRKNNLKGFRKLSRVLVEKFEHLDKIVSFVRGKRANYANNRVINNSVTLKDKDILQYKIEESVELVKDILKIVSDPLVNKMLSNTLSKLALETYILEINDLISKLNEYFANVDKNLDNLYKNNVEESRELFEKEDVALLNSKEAVENRMLDVQWAVLSNQKHANQVNKSNDFVHMQAASRAVNDAWGFNIDGVNPYLARNKYTFHDLNMSSLKLKGIAVQNINTVLVLGQLNARIDTRSAISHIYTIEELGLEEVLKGKKVEEKAEIVKQISEERGVSMKLVDSNKIRMYNTTIGNNLNNTWTDVSGNNITEQLGETVSNILDSVKHLIGKNINIDTINTFLAMTSSTSMGKFNGEWNRYGYAMAFIHQPILVDLTDFISSKRLDGGFFNIDHAINRIRSDYTKKLVKTYRNVFVEYGKTDPKLAKAIDIILDKAYSDNYYLVLDKETLSMLNTAISNSLGVNFDNFTDKQTTQELLYNISTERHNRNGDKDVSYYRYILNQLLVLNKFAKFYSTAQQISNKGRLFKTETNLGVNFEELDKQLSLISDSYMSVEALQPRIRKVLKEIPSAIPQILDMYTQSDSLYGKQKILSAIGMQPLLNIYVLDNAGKPLNLVEAVFPGMFNETEYLDLSGYDENNNPVYRLNNDFSKSAYNSIESRFVGGAWLANNTLGGLFMQRNKTLVNATRAIVPSGRSATVTRENVLNKIVNSEIARTTIFRSIPTEEWRRVIGDPNVSNKAANNSDNYKIENWVKLSAAEKIEVLKASMGTRVLSNSVLDVVKRKRRSTNGYVVLESKVDNEYKDYVGNSFKDMYMSDDFYEADLARDLLMYAFITDGFSFGYTSISNMFSDLDILSKPELFQNETYYRQIEEYSKNRPDIKELYHKMYNISSYAKELQAIENKYYTDKITSDIRAKGLATNEMMDYIHRQMYDDTTLNIPIPYHKQASFLSNIGQPTFEKTVEITDKSGGVLATVLVESKDRIVGSKYQTATYISKKVGKKTVIYKRLDLDNGSLATTINDTNLVFYYETGRLMPYEYSSSSANASYNLDIEEQELRSIIINNAREGKYNDIALERNFDNRVPYSDIAFSDIEMAIQLLRANNKKSSGRRVNTNIHNITEDTVEGTSDEIGDAEEGFNEVTEVIDSSETEDESYDTPFSTVINNEQLEEEDDLVVEQSNPANSTTNLYSPTNRVMVYKSKLEMLDNIFKSHDRVVYVKDAKDNSWEYNQYKQRGAVILNLNSHPHVVADGFTKESFKSIHIAGSESTTLDMNNRNTWVHMFQDRLLTNKPLISKITGLSNRGIGLSLNLAMYRNNIDYADYAQEAEFSTPILVEIDRNSSKSQEVKYNNNARVIINNIASVQRIIDLAAIRTIPNVQSYIKTMGEITSMSAIEQIQNNNLDVLARVLQLEAGESEKEGGEFGIASYVSMTARLLLEDIEKVNITELVQASPNARVEFQSKLNVALQMIKMLNSYGKLKSYSIHEDYDMDTSISEEENQENFDNQFGDIQKSISKLLNVAKHANTLQSKLEGILKEYLVATVAYHSRNPKIKTLFSHALEQFAKDTELNNEAVEFNMNDTFIETLNFILNDANQDLTAAQQLLDSRFDTGLPLVDVLLKMYIHHTNENRTLEKNKEKELAKILRNNPHYSENQINALFNTKLLLEDGTLISPYRTNEFKTVLNNFRYEYNKIMYNELGGDANRQLTFQEYVDVRSKQNQFRDKFISENIKDGTWTLLDNDYIENEIVPNIANLENNKKSKWLFNNNIIALREGKHTNYYKYELGDKYINANYNNLNENEKELVEQIRSYIKEVVEDTMDNYIAPSDLFPFVGKSTLTGTLKSQIGVVKVRNVNYTQNVNGELYYYLKPETLSPFEYYFTHEIPTKLSLETDEEYNRRVVKEFNEKYNKVSEERKHKQNPNVKSIEDIRTYNKEALIENNKKKRQSMNVNLNNALAVMTRELYNVKNIEDFRDVYEIVMYSLDNLMTINSTDYKGDNTVDKTLSKIMGRKEMNRKSASESRVKQSIEGIMPLLTGQKSVSRSSQAMNIANRISSLTYMFFNIRGGLFKNGLKAATDMIIKANSGLLVSKKDLAFGISHYKFQDVLEAISSAFESDPKNKDMALIKMFDYIFQDWRQGAMLETESGLDRLSRSFTVMNEVGYAPLNIAEHFAQYSMLLAMVHSHKYYRGIILSKGEWKLQVRDRVISNTNILTDEQKVRYNNFLDKQQRGNSNRNALADYTDYFSKFMLVDKTITSNQRRELARAIEEESAKSEEMWNKIPSLYDSLEFKEGKIVPKDSLGVTNVASFTSQMSDFGRRVQGVNQSLHGIYNIQDQMKVADYALGQLAIQFKKWMRPNFVRYFGRRWNEVGFSEQLMTREVPVYKIFWDTFSTPRLYAKERAERGNGLEYARLYMEGLVNQLSKIKLYYKFLPEEDKAAAREFVAHMATFIISLVITLTVLGSFDDDDDKKKKRKKKKESIFLAHLKYLSAATFAEISEPIPLYGWSATVRTFRNRPIPAYSLAENVYLAGYYGLLSGLGDPKKYTYTRGRYKGKNKGTVNLRKALPVMNQIDKIFNVESATGFYELINPFI